MVRLDRLSCPIDWQGTLLIAFPRGCEFRKRASAFERLAVNGIKRRAGFIAYAGHTLPWKSPAALKREFPPLWRDVKSIVQVLARMSEGHCAYCQKYIADEKSIEVEHFRPKSLFPRLAYEWQNYLPSCAICNSKKHNKWPPLGEYVRPDNSVSPSSRFTFERSGQVSATRVADREAELTIEDFGLNRPALVRMRRTEIDRTLMVLEEARKLPGIQIEQLRFIFKVQLRDRLAKFSEAINQNVLTLWSSAGGTLPL